jgi:L-lactate dehydrogenase complex protein LldG
MTPAERQAMRDGIARALGTADLPEGSATHPGPFGSSVTSTLPGLQQRFQTEIEALGGTVHALASPDLVAGLVRTLADREGAPGVLAWDDRWLPLPGMASALERAGCTVHHQRPIDSQDTTLRQQWAAASVGVTSAVACLAETGSLVVVSGPGRGRLASLLPPVHVALVSRSSLAHSLPLLLARRPELAVSGANMVCITGPSRTADIEHTLSRGVHGPREVHVVWVD